MRIGLVCPYSLARPGGVQNQVLGLAGWLKRAGHQPSVLAPGRATERLLSGHGLAAEDFTSCGPAVPVRFNGSVARICFDPVMALQVAQWLRAGSFDVLHLHEPITPSASLVALSLAGRTPVVATSHTATPGSPTLRLAGRVLAKAVRRIDTPLSVSTVNAEVQRSHLGIEPKIIPNGFAWADFAGDAPEPRTTRQPRVTFLGRFDEPRKGLPLFLAARDRIRELAGDVEFVVAGSGTRPTPADVTRLQPLSDAERVALLRSTDVFVAPHTGRESFGLVLIEALAAGAAVVASDLPAFAEVVTAGAEPVATLFPVGDAEALASAVVDVLAHRPDPEIGRQHVRRYDWSQIGPQNVAAYDALTSRR